MTALRLAIEDYLALRRRLGGARHEAARVLHLFAGFAEREGAPRVTTDLARRWATHFPNLSPVSVNTRFQIVRRFAEWRYVTDPLTEIPPIDLLPARYHRKPPSLYQDADIDRLLTAARQLPSPMGVRRLTYATEHRGPAEAGHHIRRRDRSAGLKTCATSDGIFSAVSLSPALRLRSGHPERSRGML